MEKKRELLYSTFFLFFQVLRQNVAPDSWYSRERVVKTDIEENNLFFLKLNY